MFLARWLRHVPMDRLLAMRADHYFGDGEKTVRQVSWCSRYLACSDQQECSANGLVDQPTIQSEHKQPRTRLRWFAQASGEQDLPANDCRQVLRSFQGSGKSHACWIVQVLDFLGLQQPPEGLGAMLASGRIP